MSDGLSPGSWQDSSLCGLLSGSRMSAHITHHEIALAPLVGHTVCVQVSRAETAMQSEWCWLECSGGSSKLFSGCWSQAHPWQEAAILLLTFQTKQCKWMRVEQVTASKRNRCRLTRLHLLNCQQYPMRFSIPITCTCIWCHCQTLLNSAQTAVGTKDDCTKDSQCIGWSRIGGGNYFLSAWTALPFHPKSKQETLHICNIHTQVCFH